jgi:epoxyqueuosine reductase
MGNWVFGCDACQDICPWNGRNPLPNPLQNPSLPEWLAMNDAEFRERFGGTALARPKRRGLARNAAIVLGNTGNLRAVGLLASALADHDEPLVRAHAAWAIGQIRGREAAAALASAIARENVPPVRREIEAATVALATWRDEHA